MQPRRKRNSARINLILSATFHGLVVALLFFVAAREGMLGKKFKEIAVVLVPKEKPPEQPKPKEPEPQVAPAEVAPEQARQVADAAPPVAAPPPSTLSQSVAPEAAIASDFVFSDGAKIVQTTSDPVAIYKSYIEGTIRSHWVRPENTDDRGFVVDVEIIAERDGRLRAGEWKQRSGNKAWDDSVSTALARLQGMNRALPKGFPERFIVRFDVQEEAENDPLVMN